MKNELLAPWVLRNVDHQGRTAFSGDDRMAIDTCSGWEMCECAPSLEHWHPEEIARVVAMRAAPELLTALRAIRKLGYASKAEAPALRKTMLKCIKIAEAAISVAESTSVAEGHAPQSEKSPK